VAGTHDDLIVKAEVMERAFLSSEQNAGHNHNIMRATTVLKRGRVQVFGKTLKTEEIKSILISGNFVTVPFRIL
jgi:hypothetical protein